MGTGILDTSCEQAFGLHLEEASGLCIRGGSSILVVGDKDHLVTTADLKDDCCINEQSHWVNACCHSKKSASQWEAIATDGTGRVFIVNEQTLTVLVLSSGLDKRLNTITLQPSQRAGHRPPENAGAEAIVLLEDGRLLTVQQKKPAQLIEFGPSSSDISFAPSAFLAQDAGFTLAPGAVTFVELHRWDLIADDNQPVPSVNDLALDHQGCLYAVSSKAQCIYELSARSQAESILRTGRCWRLPAEMELCKHRKAEGLAFDNSGRPLVVVDTKLPEPNLYLLGPLSRA